MVVFLLQQLLFQRPGLCRVTFHFNLFEDNVFSIFIFSVLFKCLFLRTILDP
jgi:hypothetical protein